MTRYASDITDTAPACRQAGITRMKSGYSRIFADISINNTNNTDYRYG